MSTLHRLATVCILGAAVAAFLPGCSSDSDSGPVGGAGAGVAGAGTAGSGTAGSGTAGAGTAGGGSNLPTGDASRGEAAWTAPAAGCNACHGVKGEGSATAGPNISGSMTAGTGAWSQAEFFNAVRNGVAKDGTMLCPLMLKYPTTGDSSISDQSLADVYAWLKTNPNETPQKGSYCP